MGKNTFGKQDDIIVSPKKMTADGSTLSDINKVHEISQQVGQPNQDGKKVITNETFWEDLEDINSDSQGIISRVNNVVNLNVISKQLSPSVPQEIEKIREKYVVGKIAGSDLYDAEGNLIISKNSVITADIVKKAEQESKLAELIVNMSLPVIKD